MVLLAIAACLLRLGLRAAIQPGDAEPVRARRPQRGEPMFGVEAVVVDVGDLVPGHPAIAGTREHRVVAGGACRVGLQPLRPQRAIGRGQQVRRVRPVRDQRATDGDRAGLALPSAFIGIGGELQAFGASWRLTSSQQASVGARLIRETAAAPAMQPDRVTIRVATGLRPPRACAGEWGLRCQATGYALSTVHAQRYAAPLVGGCRRSRAALERERMPAARPLRCRAMSPLAHR